MWLEDDTKMMAAARWLYLAAIAVGSSITMLWLGI
jgi:hypothetical protein